MTNNTIYLKNSMPKIFLPIEDVTLHIWIHFKINKLHNIISRSSQCDKCDKEKFHHAIT